MISSILPKKRTKLTILSKEDAQDSELRLFFGRIEDTINCWYIYLLMHFLGFMLEFANI